MNDIYNTALITTLRNRKAKSEHAAKLFGVLVDCIDKFSAFLEYIKEEFPEYTDHGIGHSERIINAINQICPKEFFKELSSTEIFLFAVSAITHDTGMVRADRDHDCSKEEIRNHHHERAESVICDYFKRIETLSNEQQQLTTVVSFIARSHGLSWDEMSNDPMFKNDKTLFNEIVRVKLLCILLRLGDLLDLSASRTAPMICKIKGIQLRKNGSIIHHEKCWEIADLLYSTNEIRIIISAKSSDTHRLWQHWLNLIKQEIMNANTYVFTGPLLRFQFPSPILKVDRAPNAKYLLWPMKFELNEGSSLWDLVSKSIYTGKFDYVRELIQNAIDAELLQYYKHSDEALAPSPRGWEVEGKQVTIIYSRIHKTLSVVDHGIGMSHSDLQDFLFKVSSSGFCEFGQKDNQVHCIAKFGIGFISLLSRTDAIYIASKKEEFQGVRAAVESRSDSVVAEEMQIKHPGTNILVKVSHDFTITELKNYLSKTFIYPSIPIQLIDYDFWGLLAPVNSSKLNYESGDSFGFDLSKLDEALRKEIELKKDKNNPAPQCDLSTIIGSNRVSAMRFDGICIITLNKCHTISGIAYKKKVTINLRQYESAAIFIPVEFADYESGIEWASIHSFLVSNGCIVKQIVFPDPYTEPKYNFSLETEFLDSIDEIENTEDEDETTEYLSTDTVFWLDSNTIQVNDPKYLENIDFFQYFDESKDLNGIIKDDDNEPMRKEKLYKDTLRNKLYSYYREFSSFSSKFCQDGIALPFDASRIVPVGSTKAILNLTAQARMSLNASRHDLDENPSHLSTWVHSFGSMIQRKVLAELKSQMDILNIKHNFSDIINAPKNGGKHDFDTMTYRSLMEIIASNDASH